MPDMKELRNTELSQEDAIKATEELIEMVRYKQDKKEKEEVVEQKIDEKGVPKRRLTKAEEKIASLENWVPKTKAGKMVKKGEITSIDQLYEKSLPIIEPEIIDALIPDLEEKLISFRKTCRVTQSGRNYSFTATVLVGDKNGHIGVATAKDLERWPALRKATKKAKLTLIPLRRGCGSWECSCKVGHSVPFKVTGKSCSVKVTLIPAPKGVGLAVGNAIKPVLELAGIRDVWNYTSGRSETTLNYIRATIDALRKTRDFKVSRDVEKKM